MNGKTIGLSFGFPIVFLLGSTWPVAGALQDGTPGAGLTAAVGVVNLDKVASGYAKARKINEELKNAAAKLQQRLNDGLKAAEKLKDKAELLDRFSPAWVEAKAEYEAALRALEERRKLGQQRLRIRDLRNKIEIYQDIEGAIAKVAEAKGLELVLRVREVPEKARIEDRFGVFTARETLFRDPALDLTETVIRMLAKLEKPADQGSK